LENKMIGTAVWFEIPASNFDRAVAFYERMFEVKLRRERIGDGDLAVFGGEGGANGAILSQPGMRPNKDGAVIYLETGADLTPFLNRAVEAGGSVSKAKTALPPGMGFYAHFEDCEGNRVGLHSEG
jgi:uncharacterized protein